MAASPKGGRPVATIPVPRLHRPSGLARVRHRGEEYYLGPYGSQEAARRYSELLVALSGGKPVAAVSKFSKSVSEITLLYLDFAVTYYRKNGKPTAELDCIKSAVRSLLDLFGEIRAEEFGPLALKTVRQSMVDAGWSRGYVNKSVGRVRRVFRWGCENELVSPTTLQGLQAVTPLLAGRTLAKDHAPRRPVSQDQIDRVRTFVLPRTRDLIDLQLLTGARSGELVGLTMSMLDRSGPVWLAHLTDHKTAHHGKERVLVFGPQAQAILLKYLTAKPSNRLFKISRRWYGHSVAARAGDAWAQPSGHDTGLCCVESRKSGRGSPRLWLTTHQQTPIAGEN